MRCFTRLRNIAAVLCAAVVLCLNVAFAADDIPNNPPENPPWLGGYYITGINADIGICTVYLPVNEGWCLDANGFLFRYASSSATGKIYTEDGTVYDFNASAFDTPRYRLSNSSSYSYSDFYFNPAASNVVIENTFAAPFDSSEGNTLVLIAIVGMIFVVLISRGRG